ncbi:hypothetical protein D3C76_1425540 [compost metagenome]
MDYSGLGGGHRAVCQSGDLCHYTYALEGSLVGIGAIHGGSNDPCALYVDPAVQLVPEASSHRSSFVSHLVLYCL